MGHDPCDVAICGAGPAGLAAAAVLARAGLAICLLDEQPRPGGQLLRRARGRFGSAGLESTRRRGLRLLERSVAGALGQDPDRRVVGIFGGREILAADGGEHLARLCPRAVLIATGARERYLPFAGWTLPGVMGAGAAQILVKSHGVLPARRLVVAGAGPLLYAAAAETAAAGGRVVAVLDQAGPAQQWPLALALCRAPTKMLQGAGYLVRLLVSGSRVRGRWRVAAAQGGRCLERVVALPTDASGRALSGRRIVIPADGLAIGWGLAPNLELAMQAGCRTQYHPDRGGWVVDTDDRLQTSVPGIFAAGEVTGIGGGAKAMVEGELAALGLLEYLGLRGGTGGAARRRRLIRRRRGELAFSRALAAATRVPPAALADLSDDTIICRCEDVTMGEIRRAVLTGADSPVALKRALRLGMGICQGRTCGPIVADLLAAMTRRPCADLPPAGARAPVKPVRLGDLARDLTP